MGQRGWCTAPLLARAPPSGAALAGVGPAGGGVLGQARAGVEVGQARGLRQGERRRVGGPPASLVPQPLSPCCGAAGAGVGPACEGQEAEHSERVARHGTTGAGGASSHRCPGILPCTRDAADRPPRRAYARGRCRERSGRGPPGQRPGHHGWGGAWRSGRRGRGGRGWARGWRGGSGHAQRRPGRSTSPPGGTDERGIPGGARVAGSPRGGPQRGRAESLWTRLAAGLDRGLAVAREAWPQGSH